jgi:hypothetical protein
MECAPLAERAYFAPNHRVYGPVDISRAAGCRPQSWNPMGCARVWRRAGADPLRVSGSIRVLGKRREAFLQPLSSLGPQYMACQAVFFSYFIDHRDICFFVPQIICGPWRDTQREDLWFSANRPGERAKKALGLAAERDASLAIMDQAPLARDQKAPFREDL